MKQLLIFYANFSRLKKGNFNILLKYVGENLDDDFYYDIKLIDLTGWRVLHKNQNDNFFIFWYFPLL